MVSNADSSEALAQRLSDSGLRATPQRELIYDVLLTKRDHPTAEEVFSRESRPEMPDDLAGDGLQLPGDARAVQSGPRRQLSSAARRGIARICSRTPISTTRRPGPPTT
jgi:hypothetical protein